jgi:hypothetical protein
MDAAGSVRPQPNGTASTDDELKIAKTFLFWAFVVSLVLLQLSYTYILYRHHQIFLKAANTEFLCGSKSALERETPRYQLRRYYLNPSQEQIETDFTRYNNWRLWVIWYPAMIAGGIFMMIKYGTSVISPVFYGALSLIGLYLGFYQMYELPSVYGFPPFWSWKGFQYGEIHRLVEYHTQSYLQIHSLLDARLEKCMDEDAEYNCMELMPASLKEALVRRYVSANPDTNVYQAAMFFEEALKKKDYDTVIGYMRLSEDAEDLRQLAGMSQRGDRIAGFDDEWVNQLHARFSADLIRDIQKVYWKSFWLVLVVGWALILYFIWFHRLFSSRTKDADIDSNVKYIWVVIGVGWLFHYFIL